jgi:predicted dehydrogenase
MAETGAGPVSVLMVAIGGYGQHYLNALLALAADRQQSAVPQLPRCRLAGVVDPMAAQSPVWPVVSAAGVPAHDSIEQFYAEGHRADLAVISSPIHWHAPQTIAALSHGSAVLCDKPLGATIQEVEDLIRARRRSGSWVMVGYQWSFSSAILALKRDVRAGLFGHPTRASALCLWPRDLAYYRRNDWAGRLRHDATGRWVLDGPANNAMAHFLHNLFFVLGPEMHLSARPRSVQAELYRAYPIESCDTAVCRAETSGGVEVLFYASHVTEHAVPPRFRLEFEDAVVSWDEDAGKEIVAVDRGGRRKQYGSPDDTPQFVKLCAAIDRVSESTASRTACLEPVICGPEAAISQTLCVNAMHESVGEISGLPPTLLRHATPDRVFVEGLDATLVGCYALGILPSEARADWAVRGRKVELAGYHHFPGGARGPQGASPVDV